jgi:MSHA pilin protein MshD
MRHSADPVVNKQMLAVAEGLVDEILLKPHAVNGVAPANSPVACGAAGAVRVDFDDVRDYHAYETRGVCDIDGDAVPGLAAYRVRVEVVSETWQGVAETLRVQVSISRDQQTLTLTGRRTPYAL